MKKLIVTLAFLVIATAATAGPTETVAISVIAHGQENSHVQNVREIPRGKLYFEELICGIDGYTVVERTVTAPWQIVRTRVIDNNVEPKAKSWRPL